MARNAQTDLAVVDTRPEVARVCPLATSATPSNSHPGDVRNLRPVAIVFLPCSGYGTERIGPSGSLTAASYNQRTARLPLSNAVGWSLWAHRRAPSISR